jgi:hypothetical protein
MTTMATRLPKRFAGTTAALRKAVGGNKPSKYRNQPVEIDGHRFASKAEGKRYQELMLLVKAGEIINLELQPRYPMAVNGEKICTYVADFAYDGRTGLDHHVEDVKGIQTDAFRIKAKLFKAIYGRDIELIGRKK